MNLSDIVKVDSNLFKLGVQRILLLLATVFLLTTMMTSLFASLFGEITYKQGEVARSTVVAPRDYLVEDVLGTEEKRNLAAQAVNRVFVLDDSKEVSLAYQLSELFEGTREAHTSSGPSAEKSPSPTFEELLKSYRLDLSPEEQKILLNSSDWPRIGRELDETLSPLLQRGIIGNRKLLQNALKKHGALLRYRSGSREQELESPASVHDLVEAENLFVNAFEKRRQARGPGEVTFLNVVEKIGRIFLKPNVVFDSEETERRIQAARDFVDQVFFQVRRGEVVVRYGDIISAGQERKLEKIRGGRTAKGAVKHNLGYFVLVTLVICSVYWFTIHSWKAFKPKNRDLSLMSLVLVGTFFLVKLYVVLGGSISMSYPDIDPSTVLLAAPIAAAGILLQVTLGPAAVFFFTATFVLLSGVFLEEHWSFLILTVLGNIAGAASVTGSSRRSAFISAGARIALANTLVILSFILIEGNANASSDAARVLAGIVGGITSGMLATFITPIAEFAGSYVTDIKLLELASLDRPLLRDLSMEAPGTWNHSVVMGQLGEAGAEAIGANSLLTRVGAYYHDVGKTRKPLYFTENQIGTENRHDRLTPSMSALIIKSHVKDGVDMALQHRLPQAIVDFIPQHHGTSLIEFFFDKAKKDAEDDEEVDETHYRYPGPKPQTREAGILMLADGIEAASRTLSDRTPARIQGMVQKLINKVFASGQLDESELTLRDLHLIAKSFTRVLNAIYHRRVEYAEPAEKIREAKKTDTADSPAATDSKTEARETERKHGSRDNGEADGGKRADGGDSDKGTEGGSKETLKRLGM